MFGCFKKYTFFLVLSISFFNLNSMDEGRDNQLREKRRSRGSTNFNFGRDYLEANRSELYQALKNNGRFKQIQDKSDERDELIGKVEKSAEDQVRINLLTTEIDDMIALVDGGWGDAIALGLTGKGGERMLKNIKIGNDFTKGIGMGALLRGTLSVEKAVGSNIDRYVKGFFDITLGSLERFIVYIYRLFFHGAGNPFYAKEIEAWKKMVRTDFMALETMIKDAGKFDSHGREDILREYEQEGKEASEKLNLWKDFIEDQAVTYNELSKEIALRSCYYAKKDGGYGITNCARRLEHKLLKVSSWLLSVSSLKDFANIPEMKSVLPAMRKSIDNYFSNLIEQVTPLNGSKSRSSFADKSDWSSPGFGSNNDYPGVMDNTF